VGKGVRIFYLFIALLAVFIVLFDDFSLKSTLFVIIVPLILSIVLIMLWDYINKVTKDSNSILLKIIKGVVKGTSYFIMFIIAIGILIFIVADSADWLAGIDSGVLLLIIVIIWSTFSITGAVNSTKKGSK